MKVLICYVSCIILLISLKFIETANISERSPAIGGISSTSLRTTLSSTSAAQQRKITTSDDGSFEDKLISSSVALISTTSSSVPLVASRFAGTGGNESAATSPDENENDSLSAASVTNIKSVQAPARNRNDVNGAVNARKTNRSGSKEKAQVQPVSRSASTSTSTTTTRATKKTPPPKKYVAPAQQQPEVSVRDPTTTEGPTKFTLNKPTFSSSSNTSQRKPTKKNVVPARAPQQTTITKFSPPKEEILICPTESQAEFNLFAPSCQTDRDCSTWNKGQKCCKLFGSKNCIRGVPKPPEEPKHNPAFFGLLPRRCPERPLAELWWDIKSCETDNDCWPRICCPDGARKYCRASAIEYSAVPLSFGRPIAYFSEYLECTPPPPPVFDLHPKPCNSTFDCFPNVCCQEAGRKHCRPPKKSILTLMANFLNTGLLKRLTNNLVIR